MFRLSSKKALKDSPEHLSCPVNLLVPGDILEVVYYPNSSGQDIMDQVVEHLNLLDKDYYGLKLHDQIQWLDMSKDFIKQIKHLTKDAVVFDLRFKYYPAEPALIANESTRYYLYLQLRLDLIEGRLRSDSPDTQAYLIACILQSELGDYNPSPVKGKQQENYVAEFKFVPNQTEELEWLAIRLHQNEDFQGLEPADSELNFIKKACLLDTYGIDPYPVKEGNSQNHFLIGVNHRGISTYQDSKKINQFSWNEIERISLDNKLVLIYCRKPAEVASGGEGGKKSSKSTRALFGFRCPSRDYAHNFWIIATEHKFFFTLDATPESPIVKNTGGLFKKSHKLKYTGRVEKDVLKDHVDEVRSSGVKRSHSLMSKSFDGPKWQGFQQGNNMQGSLRNLYASDILNKTMPSNMNYFREEEEEEDGDEDANEFGNAASGPRLSQTQKSTSGQQKSSILPDILNRKRNSSSSLATGQKDSPKTFTRRPVLTAKSPTTTNTNDNAIRRGSQIFLDTEHKAHDFLKTTIFLVMLLIVFLLTMLLISDTDRPSSVSLLVKKMNLERTSLVLRQNYYLPLKSALFNTVTQLFSILDTRIL